MRGDSEQFYHVDFMALLTCFSEKFLGEDTSHELIKAFRVVERAVLYQQVGNPLRAR